MSNFLKPLVGKNKYIHRNTIPKSPFNSPIPSPNNSPITMPQPQNQQPQIAVYTGPGSIDLWDESHTFCLCPPKIDLDFIITKSDGQFKDDHFVYSRIRCIPGDKESIKGAILYIFKAEKLNNYDPEWFKLGWSDSTKQPKGKTIFDYDMSMVDWSKCQAITFEQRETGSTTNTTTTTTNTKNKDSAGKQQNKKDYESQTAALIKADDRLRKGLGADVYKALKNHTRVYLKSKFDLGVYNKSWDEVREYIIEELYPREPTVPAPTTVPTTKPPPPPPPTAPTVQSSMDPCMMMMTIMMMQQVANSNKQQPIFMPQYPQYPTPYPVPSAMQIPQPASPPTKYVGTHSANTNTKDKRSNPISAQLPNLNTIFKECIDKTLGNK